MNDVLELYAKPHDEKKPVVCFDEKLVQLLSTPRGEVPAKPGKLKKADFEYKREGTANVFMAVEPKGGKRFGKVTSRRTQEDVVEFLFELAGKYPGAEKILLICDQLNVHRKKAVKKGLMARYGKKESLRLMKLFEWHHTPVHGSWLDAAEIEFRILSQNVLEARTPDRETLTRKVLLFEKARNEQHALIHWNFTPEKAAAWLAKKNYPN